jgi:hypothetical protein
MKSDDGSAIPEFIVIAVGIMIPIGYLIVALGTVLGAYSAANFAVREAARVYVRDVAVSGGEFRARQAAQIAFADRGIALPDEGLEIECSVGGCLDPGGRIRVTVDWTMPLPWLPAPLDELVEIPVVASEEFVVDSYRPAGI